MNEEWEKGKIIVNKAKRKFEIDEGSIKITSSVEIYTITNEGKIKVAEINVRSQIDESLISNLTSEMLRRFVEVIGQVHDEILDKKTDTITKVLKVSRELNKDISDITNFEWIIIDIKPRRQ
jgi:hypothetical protein